MPVVLYEKKEKIGYETINRPAVMNAVRSEVHARAPALLRPDGGELPPAARAVPDAVGAASDHVPILGRMESLTH